MTLVAGDLGGRLSRKVGMTRLGAYGAITLLSVILLVWGLMSIRIQYGFGGFYYGQMMTLQLPDGMKSMSFWTGLLVMYIGAIGVLVETCKGTVILDFLANDCGVDQLCYQ